MQIELLDWPAAAAMIGIASTIGAYWLQNRREEREEEKLLSRFDEYEKDLGKLDELVGAHAELLATVAREASRQNDLTNALVERTDAQDELVDAQKETADELAKRLDDHLQSPEGPPASYVSTQDDVIEALTEKVDTELAKLGRLHNECGRLHDELIAVRTTVNRGTKRATKIRDRQSALIGTTLFVVEKLELAERRRGASSIHRGQLVESIEAIEGLRDEPDEGWVVQVEPQPVDDDAPEDS